MYSKSSRIGAKQLGLNVLIAAFGLGLVWVGAGLAGRELLVADGRRAARELVTAYDAGETRRIVGAIEALGAVDADIELRQRKFELELLRYKGVASRAEGGEALRISSLALERRARDVVALAPVNGWSWCALAELAVQSYGATSAALRFLQLCFVTAPREALVTPGRFQIAIALWPLLPDALRARTVADAVALVRDERAAGSLDRLAFVGSRAAPEQAEMIRALVVSYRPELAGGYDKLLAEYSKSVR